MKKTFAFLSLMFVLAVAAGFLSTACNSVSTNPVSVAILPTNTPAPTTCTIWGNADAAPTSVIAMASGDVMAIPFTTGAKATTANQISFYFNDTGTASPFPASDVLETALYVVNKTGTAASFVAGSGSNKLIGKNTAAGWVTVGFGGVSLSKATTYLVAAQYIQDSGNSGNSQAVSIGAAGSAVTTSYMTNSPIEITAPGSSWTLPTAGTNGYELDAQTCP